MPLRPYFAWVGSILLVALFVADWCFPAPVHAPRSEIPPHERVNLRIHFGSQMAGKSGVRHHASAIDTRRRHQSRARRRARAPENRAADRAFHGLEGFFPHPLAGEAGSPLNIAG